MPVFVLPKVANPDFVTPGKRPVGHIRPNSRNWAKHLTCLVFGRAGTRNLMRGNERVTEIGVNSRETPRFLYSTNTGGHDTNTIIPQLNPDSEYILAVRLKYGPYNFGKDLGYRFDGTGWFATYGAGQTDTDNASWTITTANSGWTNLTATQQWMTIVMVKRKDGLHMYRKSETDGIDYYFHGAVTGTVGPGPAFIATGGTGAQESRETATDWALHGPVAPTHAETLDLIKSPYSVLFDPQTYTSLYVTQLAQDAALSGNIDAAATLTGDMSYNVSTSGDIIAATSLTGDASLAVGVSGDIDAQAVLSGDLGYQISLQGTVAAQTALTGNLTTTIDLSGTIAATSSLTGELELPGFELSGSIDVQTSLSGDLEAPILLSGQISATTGLTGALSTNVSLSGIISAQTLLSGVLSLEEESQLEIEGFLIGSTLKINKLTISSNMEIDELTTG